MPKFTPLIITASLLLALSACGGGGDSTNDDSNQNTNGSGNTGGDTTSNTDSSDPSDFAPLSINAENADDVAGMAVSLLDLGLQSTVTADSARLLNSPKSTPLSKAKIASIPCEISGTSTLNGGDGDDTIEVDDYFEFVDNDCATQETDSDTNESYVETSNGLFRIDVVRVTSQDDLGYKIIMDQTYSTSHGHSGSTKGNGTFDIKLDGNGGQSVKGNYNITSTYDGKSVTFNPMQYSMDVANEQYTYDYNAEIYGSAILGSISIDTDPSFTGPTDGDYPTAGTLTITGSNSSIILNVDTGTDETVQMTINDNGSISSREVTWVSLEDPEPLN